MLQTNGCLRFLKKWPAKFAGQKVVGCRKVVRDVDTEETLVELTADHHDLMTTVLPVEGNETLDGEEEDEEDEDEDEDEEEEDVEEEDEKENSADEENSIEASSVTECGVKLKRLKYNDYVNQAENSQMKLPQVRLKKLRLEFADDDSTPKIKERLATVDVELVTSKPPTMKNVFVALEKIDIGLIGAELDSKGLNEASGVLDRNKQITSSKVQVNFVNDDDSPKIVEKSKMYKEPGEKSPQDLETSIEDDLDLETSTEEDEDGDDSVEDGETSNEEELEGLELEISAEDDEDGDDQDETDETSNEEELEVLEEEAEAEFNGFLSWLKEGSAKEPDFSAVSHPPEMEDSSSKMSSNQSEMVSSPVKSSEDVKEELGSLNYDENKESEENTEHGEYFENDRRSQNSKAKLCVKIILDDNATAMKDLERCQRSDQQIPLFQDTTLPAGWTRKVTKF